MKLAPLILAFCFFLPFTIYAGSADIVTDGPIQIRPDNVSVNPGERKLRRLRGKMQVKNLKDGILLVRLKTDANRIAAFEKKGLHEKAEKVRSFRREYNLRVVHAFRQNYRYSDVLFFFNTDSEKLKSKQYDSIFLDDNLNIDPSLKPDTARFLLIAEFDVLEADTAKHRESTYWNPGTKKLEYTYWSSSPNFSRRALVVRDMNFVQLKRPFPYYASCQNEDSEDPLLQVRGNPVKRTVAEAVILLDMKLHRKYKRYSRKR